jgi:hypothetical protein
MSQAPQFRSIPRRLGIGVFAMALVWLHLGLSVIMFYLALMTANPEMQPLLVDGRLIALAFVDFIGAWLLVRLSWRSVGRWYGCLVAALLGSIWLFPVGFIPLLGVAVCFAPVSVGGPAAVVLVAGMVAFGRRRLTARRTAVTA